MYWSKCTCDMKCYRNDGWTLGIDSDWQLLSRERMWCGWIPVVIHLIASGLQNAMAMVMSLIGAMLKYLCQGSRKVGVVSWMLAAVSVPFLYVCSGISLLFVIVALVLKVSSTRTYTVSRVHLTVYNVHVCWIYWLSNIFGHRFEWMSLN